MKRLPLYIENGIVINNNVIMFRVLFILMIIIVNFNSANAVNYTVINHFKSQKAIWSYIPSGSKTKVIVGNKTQLNFPTNNPYMIGFFKIEPFGTLINVGQGVYVPNSKSVINLKYDNTGNTGYVPNDRFITLIKDTITKKAYAVEFNYKDNKNYYLHNDSCEIVSIKLSSWNNFPNDTVTACRNIGFNLSYTPIYGLGYQLIMPNPIKADTNTNSLYTDTLSKGSYMVSISYSATDKLLDTLNFKVIDNPLAVSLTKVDLCEGDIYNVKSPSIDYVLNDKNNNGLTLNKAGEYYYELNYKGNCPIKDTVSLTFKNCSDNKNIISPNKNTKLSFKEKGIVKVFNKYDQLMITLSAPIEWDGTDTNGDLLAPGVYFAVYENEKDALALTILH